MSLTMSDLRVRNYEWPLFEGDSLTKAKNSLMYIEQLASMTKRDISGLDMSLFVRADGQGLVSDRNKINKIFFSIPDVQVPANDQIPELLKSDLSTGRIPIQSANKRGLEDRIKILRREAADITRNLESKLTKIKEVSDDLENLSDETAMRERFMADLNKVLSMGFFKYRSHDHSSIIFETAPIVLRYFHKLHQVDVVVPFGKLKVCFETTNFLVYIERENMQYAGDNLNTWGRFVPGVSNLMVGDFIHPHIGSGGSVCWGQINVTSIMERRDFGALMMALEHVLTNYNHESPYVSLPDYKRRLDAIMAYQKGENNGTEEEEAEEYCGGCDNIVDECSCEPPYDDDL